MPVNQTKTNILLVDDNPNNLVSLEVILKDLNQTLIYAHSGKEALKHTLKQEFAVILMDAHMPGIDGFEVVRLLRQRDKTRYTPIIFVSALYKNEIDVRQGYDLGAVDYIFKPIVPEILRSKVKVFIDLISKSTHAQMLQAELQKRETLERGYKQLAQQMQLILSSVSEGICGINLKGRIVFANPAASMIFATPLHELIGQSLLSLLGIIVPKEKNHSVYKHPLYEVMHGSQPTYTNETILQDENGNKLFIEYTATTMRDKRSRHNGAVVVLRDISERKRTEELSRKHQQQLELEQVARLNTMKEMASTMAHELTQPLAIISNYLKGCSHRLAQNAIAPEELLTVMHKAEKQSARAGTVIHRIKSLVHQGKLYYEQTDLNHTIQETVELMEEDLQTANVQLDLKLAKKLPIIEADKIQLQQVLLNLLRNSLDAMSSAATQERLIIITTRLHNKMTLTVDFMDTGPGFAAELSDKLFDTYFTTKAKGMGMGLAISRTIIEAHGGALTAQPNPSGGAWFHFTLPISNKE